MGHSGTEVTQWGHLEAAGKTPLCLSSERRSKRRLWDHFDWIENLLYEVRTELTGTNANERSQLEPHALEPTQDIVELSNQPRLTRYFSFGEVSITRIPPIRTDWCSSNVPLDLSWGRDYRERNFIKDVGRGRSPSGDGRRRIASNYFDNETVKAPLRSIKSSWISKRNAFGRRATSQRICERVTSLRKSPKPRTKNN